MLHKHICGSAQPSYRLTVIGLCVCVCVCGFLRQEEAITSNSNRTKFKKIKTTMCTVV